MPTASGLLPSRHEADNPSLDFKLIADSIPHMVWVATPDGATEYFNRWGTNFTGLPPETNYGWGWLSLIHPDDADRAQCEWERAARAEVEFETEWRVRRADGEFRWLAIRGVPIRGADGAIWRWFGTCTDVEQAKQLEQELRTAQGKTAESLTLLETLQATAPVGLAFIDRQSRIVRVNDTIAAVAGSPAEEQVGRPVAEVVPELWPELEQVYRSVVEYGDTVVGREIAGPSAAHGGAVRNWLCSFYPVRSDNKIVGLGVVVFDITERKQAEDFRAAVMENMAEGVYALDSDGRVTFMNAAASKLLGWNEGELRGKSMHEHIHYQRADGTAFPARECQLLKVHRQGQPTRVQDDAFTRKDGTILPVSYSAAPLLNGSNGNGVHGVVVVFRDTSDEAAERAGVQRELAALAWIGRIRDALDQQRLVLYSQPILPLGAGGPREELLVRMLGPEGELILPGSFLPVAEKYGLIGEIDRWVITQSARLAATGRNVQTNVSADSIARFDLLSLIERELAATGANPANLVFEITETALMHDIDAGERFAWGITELGCRLALDDFGTGFASFTYLKRLPVSYLKIDHEFVRDLLTDRANQHLVEAIVGLARGFGYQTMAEGVEDEETLELLRRLGVDYAQGFHLARPAPV